MIPEAFFDRLRTEIALEVEKQNPDASTAELGDQKIKAWERVCSGIFSFAFAPEKAEQKPKRGRPKKTK